MGQAEFTASCEPSLLLQVVHKRLGLYRTGSVKAKPDIPLDGPTREKFLQISSHSVHEDMDKPWNDSISIPETRQAIIDSKSNSSGGPDGITNNVYKLFSVFAVSILCHIFNLFFICGVIPPEALRGLVIAIPKPSGGFRPITCLNNLIKILEKILLKRLTPILEPILPDYQYGFRDKIGAEDQLLNFVTCMQSGGPAVVTFFDIKKAFDRASREHLLIDLYNLGIREKWGTL